MPLPNSVHALVQAKNLHRGTQKRTHCSAGRTAAEIQPDHRFKGQAVVLVQASITHEFFFFPNKFKFLFVKAWVVHGVLF